jgi:DNA-binding transcriptional LysR family regulator
MAVPMRVLTTNLALNVGLARSGAGLTVPSDNRVRDAVARGDLVPALKKFSTLFPGLYPYYPHAAERLARTARLRRVSARFATGGPHDAQSWRSHRSEKAARLIR